MTARTAFAGAVVALTISLAAVSAQQQPMPPGHPPSAQGPGQGPAGRPPMPPPEAFAACDGMADGKAVSFVSPRGHQVTAVCMRTPDGRLFARPDHPPGWRRDAGMTGPSGQPGMQPPPRQ